MYLAPIWLSPDVGKLVSVVIQRRGTEGAEDFKGERRDFGTFRNILQLVVDRD